MSWFDIKALADPNSPRAEIFIYGDIGTDWWEPENSNDAKRLIEKINNLGPQTEISVRLNSFGGSLVDGIAIFNALRRNAARIVTHNDGAAYSAASLIFMAGDDRHMAANATLMIHAPLTFAAGNAAQLRREADMLDKYAESMIDSYMVGTLSRDEIRALLMDGEDHWYTADEAQAAGFVTAITEASKVAAAYRRNRFTGLGEPPTNNHSAAAGRTTPGENPMPANNPAKTETQPPNEQIDLEAIKAETAAAAKVEALAADATRRANIRGLAVGALAGNAAVAAVLNECADDIQCTVETARERVLAKLAAGAEPAHPTGYTPTVNAGVDERDKFVAAGVNAMLSRWGVEPRANGNPIRSGRLIDVLRETMARQGVPIPTTDFELATMGAAPVVMAAGGMTRSDFPVLFEEALHKVLVEKYRLQSLTWSRWCSTGSVTDFRSANRYVTGLISDLDDVNEEGEYKIKTIPDAKKEQVRVTRKGNRLALTVETIMNDDMGALIGKTQDLAMAAARRIENMAFALLLSNPTMNEDSTALFHSTHNNLITTGGLLGTPTVPILDGMRTMMRKQKDISGTDYIDLEPAIWLGPVDMESGVRLLNENTTDPTVSNKFGVKNIVAGMFSDIVGTPRLSGTAFYMLADPMIHPTIEITFLEGMREPKLSQTEIWSTSGLEWKIEHAFQANQVGWRGALKNNGA